MPEHPRATHGLGPFLRGPGGLLVVLLLALAVRLPGLATFGYGVDEGNTAAEAIRLVDVYDWKSWDIQTHKLHPLSGSMPLSYYAAAAGLETVGRTFVGLRIPFLLLGLLSIALTWLVARRVLARSDVAILAAFYLALNPAHTTYSQFARFYIPTLLMGLLLVLTLHAVIQRPGVGRGLGLAIVLALGYLTHHLFSLLLPIVLVYVAVALARPVSGATPGYRTRLVLVILAALVISCFPLISNVPEMIGDGDADASVKQARDASVGVRNVVRAGGGALLRVEPALLLLAALGAWVAIRRFGRGGLLLALLAFALAAETLSMGFLGQVRGRYVIWCIPYFAILAAVGTLRTARGARRPVVAVVLGIVVTGTLTYALVDYHRSGWGRRAAADIRIEARDLAGDDRVVILGYGPPVEAMRLADWDVDRVVRIPSRAIPTVHLEMAAHLGERLVLVSHQQTEPLFRQSILSTDPRLRLVRRLPDPTRRQDLYYVLYEWRPAIR